MEHYIIAFPTLGKTFVSKKYPGFIDLDWGRVRHMYGGDAYSNSKSDRQALEKAERMFFRIARDVSSDGIIVLTNEPKLEFPAGSAMMVLPSYGLDETLRRLRARRDSEDLISLIRKHFSSWIADWKSISKSRNINLYFSDTLESFLRSQELISK